MPLILDIARTEADKQALLLAHGAARISAGRSSCRRACRPIASTALRRAFDATMKDPAFLAEAEKTKIDLDPLTGEEVQKLVEQVSHTPADVGRARARGDGEQIALSSFRDAGEARGRKSIFTVGGYGDSELAASRRPE